ncbi:MAG: methyltransferase domain-containing protein [Chloroflexota bacterium]
MADVDATKPQDPRGGYRRRLYATYVSETLGPQEWWRGAPGLRRDIVRHLPRDVSAPILEIGCGHGDLIAVLKEQGYRSVSGVDGSAEQVALAHQMGRAEVELADIRAHLADRPSAYQAIVAIDVLEHFAKDEILDVLDAVWRALLPGGTIIIRSPNGAGPFAGRTRYADFTHEVAFTTSSITQVLRATGFAGVRVYPCEPAPHGFLSSARLVIWRAFALVAKAGLAAETGVVRGHIVTQDLIAVATKPTGTPPSRGR